MIVNRVFTIVYLFGCQIVSASLDALGAVLLLASPLGGSISLSAVIQPPGVWREVPPDARYQTSSHLFRVDLKPHIFSRIHATNLLSRLADRLPLCVSESLANLGIKVHRNGSVGGHG